MNLSRHDGISRASLRAPDSVGLLTSDPDDERLLQDFLDDVSLSAEELKVFIAMPEFSIADVRRFSARSGQAPE